MTTTLPGFGPFLALLPHQFGFTPDRSVVVVPMRGPQVCAVLRLDETCLDLDADELVTMLSGCLEQAVNRFAADSMVTVAFRTNPETDALDAFNAWLESEFVPVQHSFVICGDVWWSTTCETGCCDGALHELETDDLEELAQEAGFQSNPAPSREAATGRLLLHDPEQAARVERAARAVTHPSLPQVQRAWDEVLDESRASVDAMGVVVAAIDVPQLRDHFLSFVVPEVIEHSSLFATAPAMQDIAHARAVADAAEPKLLRHLPRIPEAARPYWLALIALSRWRNGDQCGAGLAGDLAVQEGPQTPLASLVATALQYGMPYPHPDEMHPKGAVAS